MQIWEHAIAEFDLFHELSYYIDNGAPTWIKVEQWREAVPGVMTQRSRQGHKVRTVIRWDAEYFQDDPMTGYLRLLTTCRRARITGLQCWMRGFRELRIPQEIFEESFGQRHVEEATSEEVLSAIGILIQEVKEKADSEM